MNFFKYFAIAIAKPKQYHKFMKVSLKKGFLYLFIIVLLTSIPYMFYSAKVNKGVYEKLQVVSKIIKNDIPDFEMTKDKLTIKEDVSIDKEIDGVRVIVDKNKDIEVSEIAKMESAVVLDKSKIVIAANGQGSMTSVPNEKLEDNKLTKSDLQKQVDEGFIPAKKNASKVGVASFITNALVNYGLFLIVTAIVAGVSIITAKNLYINMSYKDLFRISLFAMTTSVFVNLFVMFSPALSKGGIIFVIAPALIYMWLGLKHIKLNGYAEEISYKEKPKRVEPKL